RGRPRPHPARGGELPAHRPSGSADAFAALPRSAAFRPAALPARRRRGGTSAPVPATGPGGGRQDRPAGNGFAGPRSTVGSWETVLTEGTENSSPFTILPGRNLSLLLTILTTEEVTSQIGKLDPLSKKSEPESGANLWRFAVPPRTLWQE